MARGRQIGRLKNIPPSPETAKKYLAIWRTGDLYKTPEKFPRLTSENFFNIDAPLTLEIGCGSGEFICWLAKNHPDRYFLGLEVSHRAINYAVDQAQQIGLDNIYFIKADLKFIYPLFNNNSLDHVYLHFPDPSHTERDKKRIIFDQGFLDVMSAALTAEGKIEVTTDQDDFFFDMLATAENDLRFTQDHPERYLTEWPYPIKTRFQKAWERKQRPLFRFILKKSIQG